MLVYLGKAVKGTKRSDAVRLDCLLVWLFFYFLDCSLFSC